MNDEVRRGPDGSIDFDFYCARAAALRRQAFRDALRSPAAARASVMAGALGFAIVIPSASASAYPPSGSVAAIVAMQMR